MISRKIFQKIEPTAPRANRCESRMAERGCARIPMGFRPKAQGCEERATLGHRPASVLNRNAVAAIPFSSAVRRIGHNPVGVGGDLISFTQGSSYVATLGYVPESRWNSRMDAKSVCVDSSFVIFPNMIPREILKKIRPIELCSNRFATAFAWLGNYGEFAIIKNQAGGSATGFNFIECDGIGNAVGQHFKQRNA
jgi:hypothetical protein